MTTIFTLKEWEEIARRSTSGDQVWDILASWETSLAVMTARCEKAEAVIKAALDYLPSMVVKSTNLDKLDKLNNALSAWQEAKP